jgi:GT2 family glycosyltransferase
LNTNKEAESISKVDEELYNLASNNKLIFIKNDDDSGFSAGNNIGINFSLKFLNPNYILLLSNDTVVDKDFLEELVTFADKDQKIGVVGPRVFYYDKPDQTAYIGHDVNLCTARISDPHDKLNEGSPSSVKVDYVVGCGLLIKRKVIEDIGLLDPNYFLYYEDCDWCLRAKKQGYGVFYVAKSRIWHKIPIPEIRSLTSLYYGNRNSFLLIKKNRKSGILWCYPLLILNKIIFSLYLLIRFKRKESFAVIQAVYDGIKGNYGHKKGFS